MGGLRLSGRVAIVTGAGSGIGRAAALLFAREGARVIANVYEDADAPGLTDDEASLPGEIRPVQADVSSEAGARRLVEAAADSFGGLDILFNNAGTEGPGDVTDTGEDLWDRLMGVNLKSVFLMSKHAVPMMVTRGKGSIVNNASINGIRGNHHLAAYSASKGGVVALTMAMALDHAGQNIRVNCICPGAIENTRMFEGSLQRAAEPDQKRAYVIEKHPMARLGRPEEVAQAALFLASDEASFITGVILPVDGGRAVR